ncbi:MAG TPA: DEAD/DEAH box helicase [Planctomycetota bacterium]|nr:DEAD/DEAH box helicase [Planctomycetota bacterium]
MSEDLKSPKFSDFAFHDNLHKDIDSAGFVTPLPVQTQCIPLVLEGKDVIGLAQTGTGKTAAFALPIIHRLAGSLDMKALVLAPTRELAQQIAGVFHELGKSSNVRCAVVVGGIPIEKDYQALRRWPNVLVATPGRLIDHIQSHSVVTKDIETLVIDEADRMHDMGFMPQINRIIAALPKERQTLLFSATMPEDVERIARRHMRTPVRIMIGRRSAPAERAQQDLLHVAEDRKRPVLMELLNETDGRVLVFVRTKRGVDRLARALSGRHDVARLHGDRTQPHRDRAMKGFREGRYRILVATDIAARGIDVADIEHVINYDFPRSPEDYVHRIGRTARVEASGRATSFVTQADRGYVAQLERHVGKKISLKGLSREPKSTPRGESPAPKRRSRRRGRRPRRSNRTTSPSASLS